MARLFNGTSDIATVSTAYLAGSSGPFTISFWMKSANLTQTNTYLLASQDDTGTGQWGPIYGYANDGLGHDQVEFNDNLSSSPRTGSQITILDTNWHHIVYRYLGAASEWAFLLDGTKTVINASISFTLSTGLTNTSVGAVNLNSPPSTVNLFNGSLAEIAFWTTNLTDANITSLAAGASARSFSLANLVAYWPLCGVASPEPDTSGAGHNLTLTGTTGAVHPKTLLCVSWLPQSELPAPMIYTGL